MTTKRLPPLVACHCGRHTKPAGARCINGFPEPKPFLREAMREAAPKFEAAAKRELAVAAAEIVRKARKKTDPKPKKPTLVARLLSLLGLRPQL